MKTGYTHIKVLLDRSGSMAAIKHDTEGGFAAFLSEQQAQQGQATIELTQFDTEHDVVYGPTPIAEVQPFVLTPRGGTALLDAMGFGIVGLGEWLANLDEDLRPDNVVFVVITDGEENSSHEYVREQVLALVSEQRDVFDWTFLFLAANQDAIATGASMGFSAKTSMTYDNAGVGGTYSSLSASVTRTRTGGLADFTPAERAASASS